MRSRLQVTCFRSEAPRTAGCRGLTPRFNISGAGSSRDRTIGVLEPVSQEPEHGGLLP